MEQSQYQVLLQKLDEFTRKYYKNQLIRGGIYSFSLLLAFFLAATSLEFYAHFDTGGRTVLFYIWLAATAGVLGRWVVVPLLKLYRLGNIINHKQAAAMVGRHFHDVNDKLLNTLQLHEQATELGESELLVAGINQKIVELKPVSFTAAIDLRENRKYLKWALPPLLILLLVVFGAPSVIKDGANRLVRHQTFFEEEAPFRFVVLNDNLQTVEQDDFQLEVEVNGEVLPETVYIQFEASQFKMNKDNAAEFRHLFKNVQHNIRFRFVADGYASQEFELKALPNPIVLNFDVDLEYPTYTGKTNETIRNTGDLVVPAGTKVRWNFNTRNTDGLHFGFGDTAFAVLPSAENAFSYSRVFFGNKSYSVAAENAYLRGRDSLMYTVNVVPDVYPDIAVEERADSLSSKRIYFRGSMKDDYGFSALNFHYRFLGNDGQPHPDNGGLKTQSIRVNSKTTQDQFFHFWDLEELKIKAGDEIEYYFEVWDNDGVNGAKSTRSGKKVFKAPSLEELAQKAEQNNTQVKDDIEKAIKEARELQHDMKDLERKLLDKKELGWEEKKQVRDMLDKNKNLQQMVETIQQESSENMREQNEYRKENERILEKQRQLEELFQDVMTDEMKEKFEELEKLMDKLNKEDLQEKLEEMNLNNKDIEKELDRSLEVFKQLEFEQKLEETKEKLDELAEKQEELADDSKEGDKDAEELKKEQDELNKEFDELKKDMEDLEKKNEELESPNELPDTEKQQEEIEQEMQKSSDELGDKKKKKASESQQNAAEQMKEMSKKMAAAMEGMQSEGAQEDLDALRQLLENLVTISFDQEDLMTNLAGLTKKDPKFVALSQQQRKLKDDAKMIEDTLFALSKRVPQIQATVNREISAINMNMEKALELMQDRNTAKAESRQQLIMTSINNLALLLDEIVQQMQQQMSQKKFGDGSCNKPGGTGQGKPSAKSMRQMQEALNKQIEKLKGQMEQEGKEPGKGKKPGQGMGGPGGQMSKEMAKMAAEQEAIRNELRKLAEEMGKEGNGAAKGEMEKLAREMEQTETDIVNKQLNRQTLMRQQEILSKLLEHEKAEREREMDNERKSKESKNENFSNPAEFFEYNRRKQKEVELLKTVPPSLSPFYKNKVNEYFNNF